MFYFIFCLTHASVADKPVQTERIVMLYKALDRAGSVLLGGLVFGLCVYLFNQSHYGTSAVTEFFLFVVMSVLALVLPAAAYHYNNKLSAWMIKDDLRRLSA